MRQKPVNWKSLRTVIRKMLDEWRDSIEVAKEIKEHGHPKKICGHSMNQIIAAFEYAIETWGKDLSKADEKKHQKAMSIINQVSPIRDWA